MIDSDPCGNEGIVTFSNYLLCFHTYVYLNNAIMSINAPELILDRRDLTRLFRQRLSAAMERNDINQSKLARLSGIDRSTLSQLLSPDLVRLPRADTVAQLATTLHVSADWLLGLTSSEDFSADIMHESLEFALATGEPTEESVRQWYEEAAGQKIRLVPSLLPDLMTTPTVTAYVFNAFRSRTPDRAVREAQGRLAYTRLPETDVEICMPREILEDFARGEGHWRGLTPEDRREQLTQMAKLTDELYPGLRLFLYSNRTHYSVPYTVFGAQRAAVYMGQMFFVFNTRDHIQVLARHFDQLIRAAVVQAPDVSAYIESLISHTREQT